MHNYLKTIGFYQLNSKRKIDKILEYAVENPDYVKEILLSEGEYLVEIRKLFGKQMGITVIGTRLEDSTLLDIEHYFPFYIDDVEMEKEEIAIQKHTANFSDFNTSSAVSSRSMNSSISSITRASSIIYSPSSAKAGTVNVNNTVSKTKILKIFFIFTDLLYPKNPKKWTIKNAITAKIPAYISL